MRKYSVYEIDFMRECLKRKYGMPLYDKEGNDCGWSYSSANADAIERELRTHLINGTEPKDLDIWKDGEIIMTEGLTVTS